MMLNNIKTPLLIFGMMLASSFALHANAASLDNCGLQVNYGNAPITRNIAFHGTATYDILAALNIDTRTTSMSGINRSSVEFRTWVAARAGQRNISNFHLKNSAREHMKNLKFLRIRYPTAGDFSNKKVRLYLAGYYQGIHPKNAVASRKELHQAKTLTYLTNNSCRATIDQKYQANFDGLMQDIIAIGIITGRKSTAEALVKAYQIRLKTIDNALKGKKLKRVFYFGGGLDNPYGPAENSMEHAILKRAGAQIIGATNATRATMRWSELRRSKPDVIVIPFNGDADILLYRREIIAEKFSGSAALKNIIVSYKGDWQNTPAAVDAVEQLASTLYPGIFPKSR